MISQVKQDPFTHKFVSSALEMSTVNPPITARKRYVSVLLFCLLKLYSIRFAFHLLFRLLVSLSRDHVFRLVTFHPGKC